MCNLKGVDDLPLCDAVVILDRLKFYSSSRLYR